MLDKSQEVVGALVVCSVAQVFQPNNNNKSVKERPSKSSSISLEYAAEIEITSLLKNGICLHLARNLKFLARICLK